MVKIKENVKFLNKNSWKTFFKNESKIINKILDSSDVVWSDEEKHVSMSAHDPTILTFKQNIVWNLISSCCEKLKNDSLGMLLLSKFLIKYFEEEKFDIKAFDDLLINVYKNEIKNISKSEIRSLISSYVRDDLVKRILIRTFDMSEFDFCVFVNPHPTQANKIEVIEGYKFPCKLHSIFYLKLFKEKNVKCAIIDGIVEKVSEIHSILEENFKSQEFSLLFSRGFSLEVLTTLHANYVKKKLNIIPIIIEPTVENPNILKDLSVVTGFNMISSLKGDLISSLKWKDFSSVDECVLIYNNIIMKNDKMSNIVKNHVKNISSKKNLERSASMSSRYINISISEDGINNFSNKLSNINMIFDIFKNSRISGIVNLNSIVLNSKDSFSKNFFITFMKDVKIELIPTITFINFLKVSSSFIHKIENIGGALLLDSNINKNERSY